MPDVMSNATHLMPAMTRQAAWDAAEAIEDLVGFAWSYLALLESGADFPVRPDPRMVAAAIADRRARLGPLARQLKGN